MGAWGTSIYDNDIAMDTVCQYKEMRKEGYTVRETLSKLWTNSLNREEILVLADKEYNMYRGFQKEHIRSIWEALKEELSPQILESWNEPSERKACLYAFANKLGFTKELEFTGLIFNENVVALGDTLNSNATWINLNKKKTGLCREYSATVDFSKPSYKAKDTICSFHLKSNRMEYEANDIWGNSGNLPCYVFGRIVKERESYQVVDLHLNMTLKAASSIYSYKQKELKHEEYLNSVFFLFDTSFKDKNGDLQLRVIK